MAPKKGFIPWNKGKIGVYSKEMLKQMSDSCKGRVSGNKGTRGKIPWNKGIPMTEEKN